MRFYIEINSLKYFYDFTIANTNISFAYRDW